MNFWWNYLHRRPIPVLSANRVLLGLCFFFLGLQPLHNACGPVQTSFQGYSFLNEELLRREPPISAFYLDFSSMAELAREGQKKQILDNVGEWIVKVCENALPQDAAVLIYQTPVDVLRQMLTRMRQKHGTLPVVLSDNTFARYLFRNECEETVSYLIFAKECEPHVTAPADSWEAPQRNIPAMEELIGQGRSELKKTKSDYIKLRYAYQLVRLAHYAGKYEEALDLYEFAMPKIDLPQVNGAPSLIYYWLEGHRAGALQALGRRVDAAYIYSQIFLACESRRQSAFRSFDIRSDAEWEQLMLLCRNKREEATLHALRAHSAGAKALEEMEKIYKLDPTHPFLEILLLREVKKLEKDLLGLEFNDKRRTNERQFGIPRPFAGTYIVAMHDFVHRMWSEGQVNNPPLWHLAEGYLEMIAGDYYAAEKNFREVEPKLKSPELREQLAVARLAAQIASFQAPTDEVESEAYRIFKEDELFAEYDDFADFLRDKLVHLYQTHDRPGKAFLTQYTIDDLRMHPQENLLEDLVDVAEKPERSSIERLLFRDEAGADIKHALVDMQAVLLFQSYQLEAAYRLYKKIPRTAWDQFGQYDPLRGTFTDCINCPASKDTSDLYNRGELLEKLIDLEYQSRADPVNSGKYNYQLGIAFYNMTYFGHSWDAMDYFRSGSSWRNMRGGQNVFPYPGAPYGNLEVMDMEQPLYYFRKAMLVSNSRELQARAAFMAAKCELIQYYRSKDFRPPPCCDNIPQVPPEYRTYFQLLQEEYAETTFYEELIDECLYFRRYIGRE